MLSFSMHVWLLLCLMLFNCTSFTESVLQAQQMLPWFSLHASPFSVPDPWSLFACFIIIVVLKCNNYRKLRDYMHLLDTKFAHLCAAPFHLVFFSLHRQTVHAGKDYTLHWCNNQCAHKTKSMTIAKREWNKNEAKKRTEWWENLNLRSECKPWFSNLISQLHSSDSKLRSLCV